VETADYLDVFIDESNEHIKVLYDQLMQLENNAQDSGIIDEIFRAAHTLKGMSATMGYSDLANLTHRMENIFDGIKYDRITVNTVMLDVMFKAVDHLNEMMEDISSGGKGEKNIGQVVSLLGSIENGEQVTAFPENNKAKEDVSKLGPGFALDEFELSILNEAIERGYANFEITITLREDCLLKGARVFMVFEVLEELGEVIKSVPSVSDLEEENFDKSFSLIFVSRTNKEEIKEKINKVSELESIVVHAFSIDHYNKEQENKIQPETKSNEAQPKSKANGSVKTNKKKTIRVNIDRLDILMNLFEELVIDKGRLEQISNELNHKNLQDTVEHMSRVSSDLQDIIFTMRMVPIDHVFNRFPRMIRQLARDLHKNVAIDITGEDTELDRTVIDEIGDPLVHLIRNAIDHGIEQPEERAAKGKPEQGIIKLEAYHSGNHVFIQISDDGAGINKEKVLKKAITNGVINQEQSLLLNDSQVFELIMESGFSTAEAVSDISGRGVGLDVVKTTIESLGGSITIDAQSDKGSVFTIQLPLTLTIVSVLLIELQKEKYAVPLSNIIETAIVHKDQIKSLHTKKVIDFRGNIVPLVFLNDIFSVSESEPASNDYVSIVIVKKRDKLTGLIVDSFIGQQEIVLKSLGNYLNQTFAISGATILGDGEVALVIDSNALIK
jgi:two-component system chemotaxis sensor kinase CheA